MFEIRAIFYIAHGITAILPRNHKSDRRSAQPQGSRRETNDLSLRLAIVGRGPTSPFFAEVGPRPTRLATAQGS